MKGLKYAIICLGMMQNIYGLKHDPYIPPPFSFEASAGYEFSYFSDVADAYNPSKYSSHVNDVVLELGMSVTPSWFVQVEVEFDETRKVDFDLLSVAPYVGYQIWNDLEGDYVALLVGGYFRYVPSGRLIDVATPYSAEWNFNLFFSLGKEYDVLGQPKAMVYAFVDAGIANRGKPYMNVDVMGDVYFYGRNIIRAGIDGFYGFGSKSLVNVNDFNGYGNINHSSLNVKIGYAYDFLVWGTFQALYKRRVLAVSYPEYLDAIEIKYDIGFSF